MCSGRTVTALAALVAAVLASCADTERREQYSIQMELGQTYYRGGHFEQSIGRFTEAAELADGKTEVYQATLGVGVAAAEYGHQLYEVAENLIRNRKKEMGEQKLARADQMHGLANKAFNKLLQLRPHDRAANYYLGLLFFRRATTAAQLPYPATEGGIAQRKRERDEAIRQFEIVLADESGDITRLDHVRAKRCDSPQGHRYLGLALLTRSDMAGGDTESGRAHLIAYLNFVRANIDHLTPQLAQTTDLGEKKFVEAEIEKFKKELVQMQGLLRDLLAGLKDMLAVWEAGKETPSLTQLEREARVNAARREIAALETLTRSFGEPDVSRAQSP
ncbi:MAG: hypothetical protein HY716_18295 [Planctomycetes bacterium]|nr:hypothetical protein [Planctomycetota bacterium]